MGGGKRGGPRSTFLPPGARRVTPERTARGLQIATQMARRIATTRRLTGRGGPGRGGGRTLVRTRRGTTAAAFR